MPNESQEPKSQETIETESSDDIIADAQAEGNPSQEEADSGFRDEPDATASEEEPSTGEDASEEEDPSESPDENHDENPNGSILDKNPVEEPDESLSVDKKETTEDAPLDDEIVTILSDDGGISDADEQQALDDDKAQVVAEDDKTPSEQQDDTQDESIVTEDDANQNEDALDENVTTEVAADDSDDIIVIIDQGDEQNDLDKTDNLSKCTDEEEETPDASTDAPSPEEPAPSDKEQEVEDENKDENENKDEDEQPDDTTEQEDDKARKSPLPFVLILLGLVVVAGLLAMNCLPMGDATSKDMPVVSASGKPDAMTQRTGDDDSDELMHGMSDKERANGTSEQGTSGDKETEKLDGNDSTGSSEGNADGDDARSPESKKDGDESDGTDDDTNDRKDGNGIKYGRDREDNQEKKATDSDIANLTKGQKAVISSANSTRTAGAGMCLAWVNDVFDRTQWNFERLWAASEACREWCHSTDRNDLKPGMIVAVESTDTSPIAGHIGIYIGDGMIRDNETWGGEGVVMTRSLDEWLEMFSKVDTPRWGWAGNCDLSIEDNYPVRDDLEDGNEDDFSEDEQDEGDSDNEE